MKEEGGEGEKGEGGKGGREGGGRRGGRGKQEDKEISPMNMASKMLNKVLVNRIQRYRHTHHDQVVLVPEMHEWFNIHKSTNVISHKKMYLGKNHMFISITAEEAFDKIQPAFAIDILENRTGGRL